MEYEKFNILENPNTGVIENYFNGLYRGPLELPGIAFSYIANPISKWTKNNIGKTIASKKVIIIRDYSKIPRVSWKTPEKSSPYFSFSNPVFSNDGQYALININLLSDFEMSEGQGYIMIFKKINGKWIYIDKFAEYIS